MESKQEAYNRRQKEQGFHYIRLIAHIDDREAIIEFAKKLREKRKKELT